MGKVERSYVAGLEESCLEIPREEQASVLQSEDPSSWYGKYCSSL